MESKEWRARSSEQGDTRHGWRSSMRESKQELERKMETGSKKQTGEQRYVKKSRDKEQEEVKQMLHLFVAATALRAPPPLAWPSSLVITTLATSTWGQCRV